MFTFREFSVRDDRCAMKVCTDGVLLGAWFDAGKAKKIVDVGTGSGVVALMAAQRYPEAQIVGVEIDTDAAEQARENVLDSPFGARVSIMKADFLDNGLGLAWESVDAIVSNPPFYSEDTTSPHKAKAVAKHAAVSLPMKFLVQRSSELLCAEGRLCVIIPKMSQADFHAACCACGLSLMRQTDVRTTPQKTPKRVLLEFVKQPTVGQVIRSDLVLMENGARTKEYAALCKDFYL